MPEIYTSSDVFLNENRIIEQILLQSEALIDHFIYDGYQKLSHAVIPWVSVIFAISIAVFGWAILKGVINYPLKEAVLKVVYSAIIILFIKDWSFFSQFIVGLFNNGPKEIGEIVVSNISYHGIFGTSDLSEALQHCFQRGIDLSGRVLAHAYISNLSPLIYGTAVAFLTFIICGLSLGYLVLAKMGLAILLSMGPLFFILLFFNISRGLFEGWLRCLFFLALIPILVYTSLILILSLLEKSINYTQAVIGESVRSADLCLYMMTAVISVLVLIEIKHIAGMIVQALNFNLLSDRLSLTSFSEVENKYSGRA